MASSENFWKRRTRYAQRPGTNNVEPATSGETTEQLDAPVVNACTRSRSREQMLHRRTQSYPVSRSNEFDSGFAHSDFVLEPNTNNTSLPEKSNLLTSERSWTGNSPISQSIGVGPVPALLVEEGDSPPPDSKLSHSRETSDSINLSLSRSLSLPNAKTTKQGWLKNHSERSSVGGRLPEDTSRTTSWSNYILGETQILSSPSPSPNAPNSYFPTSSAPLSLPSPLATDYDPSLPKTLEEYNRTRSWLSKYLPRTRGHSGSSKNTGLSKFTLPLPTTSHAEQTSRELGILPTVAENFLPNTDPTLNYLSSGSGRSVDTSLLTRFKFLPQDLDQPQKMSNALERTTSAVQSLNVAESSSRNSGSFGKMAFNTMKGGLSALSLSRSPTNTSVNDEKEPRGRSLSKKLRVKSSSTVPTQDTDTDRSRSRARSQSPFTFRRFRNREQSPAPQPLPLGLSDVDLTDSSVNYDRTAFNDDPESGDETAGDTDAETEDEEWSGDDAFDPVTDRNTERNSMVPPAEGSFAGLDGDVDLDVDHDPLGEGVNIIVPPEPYFPSTLNTRSSSFIGGKRGSRRRKSTRTHDQLPLSTARPVFQRDRCSIIITQGDPEAKLRERRSRTYVVASDLSEESRYAVEWAIGTVLRDGDKLLVVTVVENESKIDPQIPNAADRAGKLRSQQERQGLAYIIARQVTSLLQRTTLHVVVTCQAWHAKSARRMLLDIVDYKEPTMMIVGSRGLGQLKGILLGSTSHYLVEKCSVPVMVARRRLKRPPKKSAHLSGERKHISLAEAGIDTVVSKVDQDVKTMLDEIERDDNRRDNAVGMHEGIVPEDEADDDEEEDKDEDSPGVKHSG